MKKFATLMLTLVMLISCAAIGMAEDITLDVIICQYGTQTNDWFTGTGMNGTSFVKKFEEANPGIKLNLEVVSWNDVYTVVSTRISNNNAPDILNLDSFADYANEGLLLPVKDYCPEELFNDFFPSFIAQSVIDRVGRSGSGFRPRAVLQRGSARSGRRRSADDLGGVGRRLPGAG